MINNTIYDVDFTRALPAALKEDSTMLALGSVIAGELQRNIELSRLNIIYARIDELEENVLDILAYDLLIDWYDPDAAIELKRTIIKQSVKVHKLMGTKYAVESVVNAYFGSGEVRMWYEYGGEPHHFKIISDNPNITDENAEKFFRLLSVVKRLSSWLETVLIALTGESSVFLGMVIKERNREAHIMERQDAISRAHIAIMRDTTTDKTAFGRSGIQSYHGVVLYEEGREEHAIKEE